ncbi:MAG: tRNA adenosine(34) deaminase TadA [Clostridia bacterium]|nr:tRNA adenosine(34) deaminase TadA [Clostridia bacterium]
MNDKDFMAAALDEAKKALDAGEMPVGCVIVKGGEIVSRGFNKRETGLDPTAHAEIVAIRRAAEKLGDWRLNGCTMYVTLEPCPMCAGAIVQSRISDLVFGAYDEAAGCAGSVYRIPEDPAFNHFCKCTGGVMEDECKALIGEFFAGRRA